MDRSWDAFLQPTNNPLEFTLAQIWQNERKNHEDAAMKFLEVIKLRGSENVREFFQPEMARFLEQIGPLAGLAEIRLYFHAVISNDAAIHLLWEKEPK